MKIQPKALTAKCTYEYSARGRPEGMYVQREVVEEVEEEEQRPVDVDEIEASTIQASAQKKGEGRRMVLVLAAHTTRSVGILISCQVHCACGRRTTQQTGIICAYRKWGSLLMAHVSRRSRVTCRIGLLLANRRCSDPNRVQTKGHTFQTLCGSP